METMDLLEALEVALTVMGVLTMLILGVLMAGVMMISWEEKKKREGR